MRVIEQIKLDIAHDKLPVVLIGDGAGFVYSHLGTSHQSTEDIACTRAIAELAVYSPANRFEVTACMEMAYQSRTAAYLRMGKSDLGDVHAGPLSGLPSGALIKVREGRPYVFTDLLRRESLDQIIGFIEKAGGLVEAQAAE